MIGAVRGPRPRYYGWTIIWTLAVTETVSWGILYYAFAVFLVPMQTELGWSTPPRSPGPTPWPSSSPCSSRRPSAAGSTVPAPACR